MFRRFSKKIDSYLIILPIFLTIFILSLNLSKPFIGQHDYTGAFNGMIAKNYLQHGIWELKFGQIPGFFNQDSISQSYYTHYLPLLPLLIARSFSIFGVVEWAERLVPAIFSLIGVISLFLICQKLWNKQVAIFSTIFFVLTPMFIYYGNMPVPEPAVVGVMLLSFYFYLTWLENRKLINFHFLLAGLFIGGLIGWPICYLGPLLILHSLLIKRFEWKLLFAPLVLFLTVILMFIHAFVLTGDFFGGGLIDTFKSRFSEGDFSFGGESFNPIIYLRKEISWWQAYFTRSLLFLAFLNILLEVRSKMSIQKATLIIFLLFGIAHLVLFSRYVFVHDFLNIYLLPFLAVSGALAVNNLTEYLQKRRVSRNVNWLIVVLILLVFVTERWQFTKALLATNMNKKGVEMANVINNLQTSPNQTVIISPRFGDFFGVFTNFYVNNSYIYTSEDNFKKMKLYQKYRFIITIDEDIYDKNLHQFLVSNYPHKRINDLTIFTNER